MVVIWRQRMKIKLSEQAMDNLMEISRKMSQPPQVIIDNLLKNINLTVAESLEYDDIKKRSKKE